MCFSSIPEVVGSRGNQVNQWVIAEAGGQLPHWRTPTEAAANNEKMFV